MLPSDDDILLTSLFDIRILDLLHSPPHKHILSQLNPADLWTTTDKLLLIFKHNRFVSLTCHWANPNYWNAFNCFCHHWYMLLLFLSEIIEVVRHYCVQLVTLAVHLLVLWSPSSSELSLKPWSWDPKVAHCECLLWLIVVGISWVKEGSVSVRSSSVTLWHIAAIVVSICVS